MWTIFLFEFIDSFTNYTFFFLVLRLFSSFVLRFIPEDELSTSNISLLPFLITAFSVLADLPHFASAFGGIFLPILHTKRPAFRGPPKRVSYI